MLFIENFRKLYVNMHLFYGESALSKHKIGEDIPKGYGKQSKNT